jgi:hypothetical protein
MGGQPGARTWCRNFGCDPQAGTAAVDGTRTLCRARLLDAGSDDHRQAVEAYQRRFPKMVLDPAAPVLLLTGPTGAQTP